MQKNPMVWHVLLNIMAFAIYKLPTGDVYRHEDIEGDLQRQIERKAISPDWLLWCMRFDNERICFVSLLEPHRQKHIEAETRNVCFGSLDSGP